MEEERIKRYNDKLEYLNQTIKNLNDWTESIDSTEFIEQLELQKQYGIYHAFQIGIEIITDLISMIVKDVKLIPKDDYSNINIIKNKKIVNADLAAKLREANGLRNRIIHDYNGLDNKIAYSRLKNLLQYFQEFKVKAKEWLKKNC
ncbi:MAG: DUF86 domain-containing protein [Candidatus Lokiarchaeota archaeon]|nr:DUF86 domain-containing protein [Candidatus Lokiarchaeota archaeon]